MDLGYPNFRPIHEARTSLYNWLGRALFGPVVEIRPFEPYSQFLTLSETIRVPNRVDTLLPHSADDTYDAFLLDISDCVEDRLRAQVFAALLRHAQALIAAGKSFILLLPKEDVSTLDSESMDLSHLDPDSGLRVSLVGQTGSITNFGCPLPNDFDDACLSQMLSALKPASSLDELIVRHVGHYAAPADERGAQRCARFYFDGADCVDQLASALSDCLPDPLSTQPYSLVLPPGVDRWMETAASLASSSLSIGKPVRLTRDDLRSSTPPKSLPPARPCVPLFDVIRTGTRAARVVDRLLTWGLSLAVDPVAAISAGVRNIVLPDGQAVQVQTLVPVDFHLIPSDTCAQCALGLQHHPLSVDKTRLKLSAFDFWDIATQRAWEKERWGPAVALRTPLHMPSFAYIFSEHAGWLVHLYLNNLRTRYSSGTDIHVITTDEAPATTLAQALVTKARDPMVHLSIPRTSLDALIGGEDVTTIRDALERLEPLLHRQLGTAAQSPSPIVVIDEFNASNTTIRSIWSLVSSYGRSPTLYMPFLDLTSPISHEDIPTQALYSIIHPRRLPR